MSSPLHSVARAILRLAAEHGMPNRFAIHEIADASGVSQLRVGYLVAYELEALKRAAGVELDREPNVDGYTWVHVQPRGEG